MAAFKSAVENVLTQARALREGYAVRLCPLSRNPALDGEQYRHCADLVSTMQRIYDEAPAYVDKHGLDPAFCFPDNEWGKAIPSRGLRFSTRYNDLNLLRLRAPFSGYQLLLLDRFGEGVQFHDPDAGAFLEKYQEDLPDDIADVLNSRFDPWDRLRHLVPIYLEHIRNVPHRYVIKPQRRFGEYGLDIGGAIVNADTVLVQARINGLLASGVLDHLNRKNGKIRILEIGPGYGAMSYALGQIFGDAAQFILVDIPSSLYHAAVYLSGAWGFAQCQTENPSAIDVGKRCLFVANHMLEQAASNIGPVDLVMNTMSFPEMSERQVTRYGEIIRTLIGGQGLLYEHNAAVAPHHVDNKRIFEGMFPYRKMITSDSLRTYNWGQDIWASAPVGQLFG